MYQGSMRVKNSSDCLQYEGIRNEFQELIRALLCVSIDVIAWVYIFMFSFEISIKFKVI